MDVNIYMSYILCYEYFQPSIITFYRCIIMYYFDVHTLHSLFSMSVPVVSHREDLRAVTIVPFTGALCVWNLAASVEEKSLSPSLYSSTK